MSFSLNATDGGTLNQVIANTLLTQQTIARLTEQTSSGLISPDYAGLGSGARTALDLSGQLALNQTAQNNADAAGSTQQVVQTALGQIESIASNFAAQVLSAQTTGAGAGTDALAASARDALGQVASLLDTKIGNVYVFAGQDSANPPIPNPSGITQSAFYAAIQTAVSGLTANGAASVASATLAIASPGGTSAFSATLEASGVPASVDLGPGRSVQIGVLANANTDAISAGTGTISTGSYTRDLLRGLATLGSLTSAQSADPNFAPLLANTLSGLQSAVSAINTDIGGLGARQNDVTGAKTELSDTASALTKQLGNVQNVDLTLVATELSQAQTQLQASYQLIAALGQLTLAKFLPAA